MTIIKNDECCIELDRDAGGNHIHINLFSQHFYDTGLATIKSPMRGILSLDETKELIMCLENLIDECEMENIRSE